MGFLLKAGESLQKLNIHTLLKTSNAKSIRHGSNHTHCTLKVELSTSLRVTRKSSSMLFSTLDQSQLLLKLLMDSEITNLVSTLQRPAKTLPLTSTMQFLLLDTELRTMFHTGSLRTLGVPTGETKATS